MCDVVAERRKERERERESEGETQSTLDSYDVCCCLLATMMTMRCCGQPGRNGSASRVAGQGDASAVSDAHPEPHRSQ